MDLFRIYIWCGFLLHLVNECGLFISLGNGLKFPL